MTRAGAGTVQAPLLQVRGLSVEFGPVGRARRPGSTGLEPVVGGIDLDVGAGETLGLVGESGSGKTTTALALLGLLPSAARTGGRVLWRGRELLALGPEAIRAIRGKEIALIPQDPMAALHPLIRVDRQVAESVRAHAPDLSRGAARARAVELLARTGLPPDRLRHAGYPFEWSGGMRQRALIAMAIAHSPALIIADEPTTALDATTRAAVLALLRELRDETGMALLLITHDMAVVSAMADRVAVMRHGRIVEAGPVHAVRHRPADPYTAALVAPLEPERDPGSASPDASSQPRVGSAAGPPARPTAGAAVPVLDVARVSVRYPVRARGPRGAGWFTAVDRVSFEIGAGETLCLVGESGAGKSSLARAIVRLQGISGGRITMGDMDITGIRGRALRAARREFQIVFQDPYSTLNPRRRIGPTVVEPLRIHGLCSRAAAPEEAVRLLEGVGLRADHAERFPFQLSGGERQRVAIARALALEPKVVVLDEPVSSLDTATRGDMVHLLGALQEARGVAYLLIAHDLRFVRSIADRVAVMRHGQLVAIGPARDIFERPEDAYTRSLVRDAVGVPYG
jgi:peptide/nickel transport system ATP-binding protein